MKVARIILDVDNDLFCSSFIHLFHIKNGFLEAQLCPTKKKNSLLKNNGKKVSMYICCLNIFSEQIWQLLHYF